MKNFIESRKIILLFAIFLAFICISEIHSSDNYRRALEQSLSNDNGDLKNGAFINRDDSNNKTNYESDSEENSKIIMKNIKVLAPVMLAIVLILAVYFTATMEIPKNTILYAAYVTNHREKFKMN